MPRSVESAGGARVGWRERFGFDTLRPADFLELLAGALSGKRFQFGLSSVGLWRPDLSIPAFLGRIPRDRLAPIYNLFDRTAEGPRYKGRVSRARCRDFRGERLSYDEHSGVDFVCPIGTAIVAAAPGRVAMIRRSFLRGGSTVALEHGAGVVTQYTHCSRILARPGGPVARGQIIALSGAAGYDLVQFFPLIPPHLHFMVFVNGRPLDPFLAPGEPLRNATWRGAGMPQPAAEAAALEGALPMDTPDPPELERAILACGSKRIRRELEKACSAPEGGVALAEDAIHHDSWAWPAGYSRRPLRRAGAEPPGSHVELTLPLDPTRYRGARFADYRATSSVMTSW
ncbi:MAG: M23 family metallopeptidase [Bdellovibrionales bacterium]|nr:M23 family metallopeptidase [Bdellovibrionales bacterium]